MNPVAILLETLVLVLINLYNEDMGDNRGELLGPVTAAYCDHVFQ